MITTEHILAELKCALNSGSDIIPLNFELKPTKGAAGICNGSLQIDRGVETAVKQWVAQRTSFENLLSKYRQHDSSLHVDGWPHHYPSRFIDIAGVFSEGRNIFIVFPLALGKMGKTEADYFGFEFVDVWEKVFNDIVFPCVERVCCRATINEIAHQLKPVITETIYLASVFHEIGHRVGPWKVIPKHDSKLKISRFHRDILCELATDTFLILCLSDFPEIKFFVILQRLFWFGRFEFSLLNQDGVVNTDNDAWIASYLWGKLTQSSCIKIVDKQLSLDITVVDTVFNEIKREINSLGAEVLSSNLLNQDNIIREWMRASVPHVANNFSIPRDLKEMFCDCVNIGTKVIMECSERTFRRKRNGQYEKNTFN